jgi:LPXTG-site transpeptidase (sortase) family protein
MDDRDANPDLTNRKNRRRFLALMVPVVMAAAGIALLAYALLDRPAPAPAPIVSQSSSTVFPAAQAVTPVPSPSALTSAFRIEIPKIAVDAGVVTLGVDQNGTMQTPGTPTDVAWYRFSSLPGQTGNVVMAGHVDYLNYGPAVFYRLRELRPGDQVVLVGEDGRRLLYRVSTVTLAEDVPQAVADAVRATSGETVTLITCSGSFDPTTRQYDRRLVVKAERLYTEG